MCSVPVQHENSSKTNQGTIEATSEDLNKRVSSTVVVSQLDFPNLFTHVLAAEAQPACVCVCLLLKKRIRQISGGGGGSLLNVYLKKKKKEIRTFAA